MHGTWRLRSVMRVGRGIFVLYALVTAIIISVPFLVFAWEDTQAVHTRVYWYRTDASGDLEAFVTFSLDDAYPGMRDTRYPMAVVEITTDELWYAPLAGRGKVTSSNRKLMVVATEDSFTIRIRDGEGERADGGIWDFPPLDQRVAKKIEPGSIADQALKGHSDEMRAMLADILDGIPDPGEEIEATRRDALVGAVQRALREDG